MEEPQWLIWAKELQAIAQAGLAYSRDPYDLERFRSIRELSARIVSEHTGLDKTVVEGLFCNETGYQTPKIDVRGAVFRGDGILLVRETTDGCWSLPGGWAEPHLSLRENVEREVREEAGLTVEACQLIALLDRKRHNEPEKPFPYGVYKAFVLCRHVGGVFAPNIETQDSGFFPMSTLPSLSTGRTSAAQVELCFQAREAEDWQTVFD